MLQHTFIALSSPKGQGFLSPVMSRVLDPVRPHHTFVFLDKKKEPKEGNDQDSNKGDDESPAGHKNLIEKSVLGFLSKLQSFQPYIEVHRAKESKWLPAPRECATLTVCDYKMFLIGGINFDACKEMIEGRISGENLLWERVSYTSTENIQGRQCHTSICYNNKIYTFGGCFMFNRKRQLRECTNQLLEYDIYQRRMEIVKTKGYSVSARKNHCAAVFKKSMIVYGG